MWLPVMMLLAALPAAQSPDRALSAQDPELPPSREIGEHEAAIVRLVASRDSKVLFTATDKGVIQAWDLKTNESIWKVTTPMPTIVGFDVGEELLAYNSGIAVAQFLLVEDGRRRTGMGGLTAGQASTCLAIDPQDRWVWIGTDKGHVTRVLPDDVNAGSNRTLGNGGVTSIALDAKGKLLAVGGKNGTIRFVGATSATKDDKKILEGHARAVSALALAPKGTFVVSGDEDGEVRVWKYSSGKSRHVLTDHDAAIERIAIDPRAKRFASGDAAGVVKVCNLQNGKVLLTLQEKSAVTGLVFLDKGATLATTGGGDKVTLWDLSKL